MATEDIILKLQLDISDLQKELDQVKGKMQGVDRTVKQTGKDIDKNLSGRKVKGMNAAMSKTTSAASKMRGAFAKLGITIGAAFAIGAITRFIKSSIAAYNKQIQLETKLRGVLKSTGHAAGLSAKQLFGMAKEMQRLTMFGDEEIVNAQAILATFTKIKGDVFPDTIKVAADMATVLGIDLQGAVLQLGKAINEPSVGLTMLRRVGISFSNQQLEQIKVLEKAGKLYEAQGLILKELQTEFGGVAEAMAKTDAGKMKQLENAWGDLKETIGSGFTMALGSASQEIMKLVGSVEDLMKPKLSEKLEAEKNEVNALTKALMNSDAPMKARQKYYERLKILAPDIVDNIDLEKINTQQLAVSLAAYNAEMVKKIALTRLYEKAEKLGLEAGDELVKNTEAGTKAMEEVNKIQKVLVDQTSEWADIGKVSWQLYKQGSISAFEYANSVKKAGQAAYEATAAQWNQAEGTDQLRTSLSYLDDHLNDLIDSQISYREKTELAEQAMTEYQKAAEDMGLDIDDISTGADAMIAMFEKLNEETRKSEKELKEAKKAWEDHIKKVEDYDNALKELQKTLSDSELSGLGGIEKIQAELEIAIKDVDELQAELLKKGQEAHGKDFKLQQEQLDQLEQLRQDARDNATREAQEYYQERRDEELEHRQELYDIAEQAFADDQDLEKRRFELQQQIDANKFNATKRSAEDRREFEEQQAQDLIQFEITQLNKLKEFYQENEDAVLLGPIIEGLDLQIDELYAALDGIISNPENQQRRKKLSETIFNDVFNLNLSDEELAKMEEAVQKAYALLTDGLSDMLNGYIQKNIEALDQSISATDEAIAQAESALEEQKRLQEEGSASNVRIEKERLAKLTAEREQYLAEREKQVKKEKNIEKTMATIKGAITIANIWAAESPKGTAGIALAIVETAVALAAIAAAFSDSSSAVSQWRSGTATVLGGHSHEGGGVNLGSMGEAEKGEFLGILSTKNTKKYGNAMMSLFDGLNNSDARKTEAGLLSLAGLSGDEVSSTGTQTVELKEQKELRGMYEIMKQPGKSVTYDKDKRIEKSGNKTRIIYN